jgi:hypothetical protein
MSSQPLESAFDALRARLQAELDAQLAAIQSHHAQIVADACQAAEAASEERWTAKLEALRKELTVEPAAPKTESGPGVAASSPAGEARPVIRRLANALARVGEATTLSAVLDRLGAAAALEAGRTALFVVSGDSLERWQTSGFAAREGPGGEIPVGEDDGWRSALTSGLPVSTTAETAPSFAADADGLIVPLVVGDRAVAALYADDLAGVRGDDRWKDTVVMLAQQASAVLTRITAVRLSQTALTTEKTNEGSAKTPPEDESSARRYARLLVSEIKLYNESAVRVGRERRDLLTRLRPEIDRARRLYDDRVPASVRDRAQVFQQELVQTLAEGDPALLGASV